MFQFAERPASWASPQSWENQPLVIPGPFTEGKIQAQIFSWKILQVPHSGWKIIAWEMFKTKGIFVTVWQSSSQTLACIRIFWAVGTSASIQDGIIGTILNFSYKTIKKGSNMWNNSLQEPAYLAMESDFWEIGNIMISVREKALQLPPITTLRKLGVREFWESLGV